MINFKDIAFLERGNKKQQLTYRELQDLGIFKKLHQFNPILTGTIPIEIDLPHSDLDIICECTDHLAFTKYLKREFGKEKDFKIYTTSINNVESTIARFKSSHFTIEIFGQKIPTEKQNAYRHMLIEHRILKQRGAAFRNEIIRLKSDGLSTEEAFAKLLNIKGDPYSGLLEFIIENG